MLSGGVLNCSIVLSMLSIGLQICRQPAVHAERWLPALQQPAVHAERWRLDLREPAVHVEHHYLHHLHLWRYLSLLKAQRSVDMGGAMLSLLCYKFDSTCDTLS